MMVQMIDTASWINALIHEAETWRNCRGEGRKSDNIFSNWSAEHRDNTAKQAFQKESFGDV